MANVYKTKHQNGRKKHKDQNDQIGTNLETKITIPLNSKRECQWQKPPHSLPPPFKFHNCYF